MYSCKIRSGHQIDDQLGFPVIDTAARPWSRPKQEKRLRSSLNKIHNLYSAPQWKLENIKLRIFCLFVIAPDDVQPGRRPWAGRCGDEIRGPGSLPSRSRTVGRGTAEGPTASWGQNTSSFPTDQELLYRARWDGTCDGPQLFRLRRVQNHVPICKKSGGTEN